ncbi:MAG: pyruvate kinase [Phycisphaerales bacterium]
MNHATTPDATLTRPTHTKIIATLGPATDDPVVLERLIDAGVSVFRINFSHASLDAHATRLELVRSVTARASRPVAVLGDLSGPKIRIGDVPDVDPEGGVILEAGQDVALRPGHGPATFDDSLAIFDTTLTRIADDVEPGQRVLINDGAIRLLAVDREPGRELRCRVTVGGRVTTHKGINLPDTDLKIPAITPRDWECVEWAVRRGLDFLALSFVRSADEIFALKNKLAELCSVDHQWSDAQVGLQIPVVAKIEKPQALANLRAIVEASDAIMVARGDLGVEMDVAHVPVAQKEIIATCHSVGRPVIVATQMLETMIESPIPTRAEASDVANAVFDGADAVMLSAETAVGKRPGLVVDTMRRIIEAAEDRLLQVPILQLPHPELPEFAHRSAAMAHGALHIAREAHARLVAVWSQAGGMAGYLSRLDLTIPILAYTSSPVAARRMTLLGGVVPVRADPPEDGSLRAWTDMVESHVVDHNLAVNGDSVVLVGGKPLGSITAQDAVSILRVGNAGSGFREAEG